MITGAHAILYSKNADADRAFFQDVLELPSVDVGGGWLIFGLPPAEIAVHPSEGNDVHELYLMCKDIERFIAQMKERGIECTPVSDQGWGLLSSVLLPGGGKLGVYEPRHASPPPPGGTKKAGGKKAGKKAGGKKAKKAGKKAGAKKGKKAGAKKAKKVKGKKR